MGGKSVHLRLPKKIHEELQKVIDSLGFSNVQEYLRDLVRKAINQKKGELKW